MTNTMCRHKICTKCAKNVSRKKYKILKKKSIENINGVKQKSFPASTI